MYATRKRGTTNKLKWLNLWFGIAHCVSAALLLILYLTVDGYRKNARDPILISDRLVILENKTQIVEQNEIKGSSYELFWLLFVIPLITAAFHFLQSVLLWQKDGYQVVPDSKGNLPDWSDWYGRLQYGINAIRWIEYSITAGIMTWIIAQLVGITNVYLLWLLAGVMNPALQFQGWAHERINYKALSDYRYRVNWVPFLSGMIIFLGQWSIMACYFARTLRANAETPGFVIAVFVVMLLLFSGFAVILVIRALNAPTQKNEVKDKWLQTVESYEITQAVFSIVSKVSLDWIVFLGIVLSG